MANTIPLRPPEPFDFEKPDGWAKWKRLFEQLLAHQDWTRRTKLAKSALYYTVWVRRRKECSPQPISVKKPERQGRNGEAR